MPIIEDDPFGGVKREIGKDTVDPRVVARFHSQSDLDGTVFSQHHTLGTNHQQAAYGDHNHNGKNSVRVLYTDISGTPTPDSIILGTGIGQTQIVVKPGDTDRQSTAVLAADPHLTVPVLANASYIWDSLIAYSYGGAGASAFDLLYDFNVPSGTHLWDDNRIDINVTTATVATRGYRDQGNAGTPTSAVVNTGAANDTRAIIRPAGSLDVGGTPGNLVFRWAQTVSTATNLRVSRRSWLRVIRVA